MLMLFGSFFSIVFLLESLMDIIDIFSRSAAFIVISPESASFDDP